MICQMAALQMLGFKGIEAALQTLTGIEIVRVIRKGQVDVSITTSYKTFCSLPA